MKLELCDGAEQSDKRQNLKLKKRGVGGRVRTALSTTGTFILKKKTEYALKDLKEYRFPIYAYFIRKNLPTLLKLKDRTLFH